MLFTSLLLCLYVSQVFIVKPGANLDAANYGSYQTITFMGLSYSSWLSLAILALCVVRLFMSYRHIRFTTKTLLCAISVIAFMCMGVVISPSISNLADLGIKIFMPFCVYFYVRFVLSEWGTSSIDRLLLSINLFLVGQVLFCKIATGEFSANHYYTYLMDEEYFGYYNSPHPFTALLGLLTIWNMHILVKRRAPILNLILVAVNVVLMAASGVRTYVAGLAFAVAVLMLASLSRPELSRYRFLIVIAAFALLLFGSQLGEIIGNTRLSSSTNTTELSSGRFTRWQLDYNFFATQSDTVRKLFGNGFGYSYVVNQELIGVSINSLNFVIDLLIDNGIFGLLTLCLSYAMLFADLGSSHRYLALALFAYILTGLMLNNLLPYITVMIAAILVMFSWRREGITSAELDERNNR